jgi:hypothetical protein
LARREFYGFIDCGVLRNFKQEKLIQAESKNVAKIAIYPRGPKATNPEIQQN